MKKVLNRIDWRKIGKAQATEHHPETKANEPANIVSVETPQRPTVPASVIKPKMDNNTEVDSRNEVKKMETSTISRGQTESGGIGIMNKFRGTDKKRDLQSGMELLNTDFLLSIVENTEDSSPNDITMRKLSFNELLRTEKVNQLDSHALMTYAMDQDSNFGKDIQCEAIKELAARTERNINK